LKGFRFVALDGVFGLVSKPNSSESSIGRRPLVEALMHWKCAGDPGPKQCSLYGNCDGYCRAKLRSEWRTSQVKGGDA